MPLAPTPALEANLNNRIKPVVDKAITDMHFGSFLNDIPFGPITLGHRIATEVAEQLAKIISEEVDAWLNKVVFTVQPGLHSLGSGASPTGPIVVQTTSDVPYPNITKS